MKHDRGMGLGKSDPIKFSVRSDEGGREGLQSKVFVINTTHRFSRFQFTSFHETWSVYVNFGYLDSFCSIILKFLN